MKIKGQNVIITGGASGIGLGFAKLFLEEGISKCVILDVNSSTGHAAWTELASTYGENKIIFEKCDIANREEFENVVKNVVQKVGQLDIFINNAGISNEEKWETVIDINLKGTINGTQLGMKYMGKDNGGRGGMIVNIASILGIEPIFCWPVYSASKHAVIGYSRAMGTPFLFEKTGVKLAVLCPGPTQTSLFVDGGEELSDYLKKVRDDLIQDHGGVLQPKNIAKGLIQVLNSADNGSVWIIEGGDTAYEVNIPTRREIKKI